MAWKRKLFPEPPPEPIPLKPGYKPPELPPQAAPQDLDNLLQNSYQGGPDPIEALAGPPAPTPVPAPAPAPVSRPSAVRPIYNIPQVPVSAPDEPPLAGPTIPQDVQDRASRARFLAGLSSMAGQFGSNPQAYDPLAGEKAAQTIRSGYLAEQKAQKDLTPPPPDPLKRQQALLSMAKTRGDIAKQQTAMGRTAAERDPDSEESRNARALLQEKYPEFVSGVDPDLWGDLSYEDINNPLFQKSLEDFITGQGRQASSDIQLQRMKDYSDYTAQLEREKAALSAGKVGEARRLRGEERLARGGTPERVQSIRDLVFARFPEGYFEDHPEKLPVVTAAIANIENSEDFKRSSVNRAIENELKWLIEDAEKEQATNIPGWERTTGGGTSELTAGEKSTIRAAVSAFNEMNVTFNSLEKLDKELHSGDLIASKFKYETQNMSNALADVTELWNNARIVWNFGAPQSYEFEFLEERIPDFNTFYGFVNGMTRIRSLVKSARRKMKAKMETYGWKPAGGGGGSGGSRKDYSKDPRVLEVQDL